MTAVETGSPGSAGDQELLAAVDDLCATFPPDRTAARDFWAAQFDRGLAWPAFPAGSGGRGAAARSGLLVADRLKQHRAPTNFSANPVGLGMVAPVLVQFGTPAQQQAHLRPLFLNDEIWCQLFSEPGAGSDLAGLATTAVDNGDGWTVTGQKVWTTYAHRAAWGLLLARTDPTVPKHRGITAFVVDMRTPGVTVRPLRQITGDTEFNEVFLDDVHIPRESVVGAIGDGWRIALATLMNERVTLSERSSAVGGTSVSRALERWRAADTRDPALRDRLVQLYVDSECLRLTKLRAAATRRAGTPGPEDSVGKALSGPLSQRVARFCLDVVGQDGLLISGYDQQEVAGSRDPAMSFLRSRATTIEGGTTEILRNVIAERVLGLPAEHRMDKEVPWQDIPRG